ncbi:hypothetical protein GE09DRAFT_1224903 [Coniochaeta sp. 2T2.1]|nr:hypothetical protein GE09DRAFT_1224903 [Coniochaeta sp. 2T2.1]
MERKKEPAIVFRVYGKEYGYVTELGKGRHGYVYLLRNLETNELIVRKVSYPRVPAPKDDLLRPDYEACINELIKGYGSYPNIVPFLGYTIVRYPGDMISHVSYYKYCNAGANFYQLL